MARFEKTREKRNRPDSRNKRRSQGDSGKKDWRSNRSNAYNHSNAYSDRTGNKNYEPRGASGRESKRTSRNRRDFHMTKVTCSKCGVECEVPFRPTSNKPIFCDDCFEKKNKDSNKDSQKEFDKINEKLNKIMKALKIE